MAIEPSHPNDQYSRSAAATTTANRLTENYELALESSRLEMELIASVAIARVHRLEQMMANQVPVAARDHLIEEMLDDRRRAKDERRTVSRLRPRTGQVDNVVPLRPRNDAA